MIIWFDKHLSKQFLLQYLDILKIINQFFFLGSQKCLKVVHSKTEAVELGQAMLECSKDAGRLVSFSHCDNITDFMDALYEEFKIDNQDYFIGNFIYKDLERTSYRYTVL